MDSSRSSIRVQHGVLTKSSGGLTSGSGAHSLEDRERSPRFPKLDECAHFHYEHVELGALQVALISEQDLSLSSRLHVEDAENQSYTVQVTSQGKSWLLRRTYQNFRSLDTQLHRCIYDRKFSSLPELAPEDNLQIHSIHGREEAIENLLSDYLNRFSAIAGNLINCGPVLSWLELDNRGRRLLVPDNDSCPINTPAVAAAYSVKRYSAQAQDEISFEVGDMISVIDMPPPEESVWWRGKRGFEVGFFPSDCVAVIGDKVPRNLQISSGATAPNSPRDMMLACQPSKPVLRKHGKLIAFFRSFILSRPSRRRLKQSGILKERVFGCDLGEHLLNSGHDIPMVLKCCSEFIESHGIVDGIYRLSGVTSNIQKLRNAFDEDRVPGLYEDEAILQDIHSVASLLKMYFRELPNPLCTYQLYHQFVGAVQNKDGSTRDGSDENRDSTRLMLMRDAVQKLPPPHYRTLQYLIKHLARVAEHGHQTGMTPRNVAIVWAPNLLRCKALEVGGVAALQGVGVQAVVTEFLICYADLIFCDRLPALSLPLQQAATPKRSRPKSLAISTPTKLLSLEEARTRALLSAAGKTDQDYIEVGGGPSSLPAKYHTVIDLPSRKRSGSKRSPLGWKSFFSKAGRSSSGSGSHSSRKTQQQQAQPQRKTSTPSEINFCTEKAVTEADVAPGRRRLRPVKSAESLASGNNSSRNSTALSHGSDAVAGLSGTSQPTSQAPTPSAPGTGADLPGHSQGGKAGHNRSVSHDSYFDHLAETPLLSRRSSKLQEEEEEGFSSSLDLSEIQLNFELEESEMRIFSEDETLVSTFDSSSMFSQGSPHTNSACQSSQIPRDRFSRNSVNVGKRLPSQGLPHLARPEDTSSGGCVSLDPSPKKQKTSGSSLTVNGNSNENCKRSRLEEQLTSSNVELRYIDSQSPEQQQQQVLVQAEIHQPTSNHNSTTSSTGAFIGASSSPSPAENGVSDNESMTVLSSGLTTPDTPVPRYSPLREDGESSGSGVDSTPDYENMSLPASKFSPMEPKYEQLIAQSQTPSPSHEIKSYDNIPVPKPRFQIQRTPYENIQRDFLAPELKDSQQKKESDLENQNYVSAPYENMRRDFGVTNIETTSCGSPTISTSPSLSAGTTAIRQLESSGEDDTLEVSQDNFSLDLNAGFDQIYSEIMSTKDNEAEDGEGCDMSTDSCEIEERPIDYDYLSAKSNCVPVQEPMIENEFETSTRQPVQNVYQNVTNSSVNESLHFKTKPEDNVYENFVFEKSESGKDEPPTPSPFISKECPTENSSALDSNTIIYQQVKYLRRSVHEVNALLDAGSSEDTALLAQVQSEMPLAENKIEIESSSYNGSIQSNQDSDPCLETHFDNHYEETHFVCKNGSETVSPSESGTETGNQAEPCSMNLVNKEELEPAQASEFPTECEKPPPLEGAATPCLNELTHSSDDLTLESPSKSLDSSRRRFESEIGRELVRERKMTQELEEMRTASNESPRKCDRSNKCSVRELLSRFETPMESVIESSGQSPVPSRRSDPHPMTERTEVSSSTLPPCLRARAARLARAKLNSTNSLSASLDDNHFLRSGASRGEGRALLRTQTEPDVTAEKSSSSEQVKDADQIRSRLNSGTDNACILLPNDDDPQRRERIERYKEERRSFLRKKYRSESFRNEQDNTLSRLKQKAVGKTVLSIPVGEQDIQMSEETHKETRSSSREMKERPVFEASTTSPVKSPSKGKFIKVDTTSSEPITCVTVRQRIVSSDRVALKGCDVPVSPKPYKVEGSRFGFSPEKVTSDNSGSDRRFSERTRIPVSVELTQAERRPAQLVLVQRSSLPVATAERRLSPSHKRSSVDSAISRGNCDDVRRRASLESNSSQRSPIKSPSYCIKDMAALFEAKDRSRNSHAPSNSNAEGNSSSASSKQFLSSV